MIGGTAGANGGDVTGFNGGTSDYWALKLNSAGVLMWRKCLGGGSNDEGQAVRLTLDGGILLAGSSHSNNGDVTQHFGNSNSADFWLVKLDPTGIVQGDISLGGGGDDQLRDVILTPDNGYIVTGYSNSTNGMVSNNHGEYDYWIVKTDAVGTKQWQRSLGGNGQDLGNAACMTPNGNFVLAGYSTSLGGEVTVNHGASDVWLAKLTDISQLEVITGRIFHDLNVNGVHDANEPAFTDGGLVTSGTGNVASTMMNQFGRYAIVVGTGSFSSSFRPNNQSYFAVQPAAHPTQFTTLGQVDTVDFAVQFNAGHPDVQAVLISKNIFRPGMNAFYEVIVRNIGTDTVSGSVSLVPDSRMQYLTSAPLHDYSSNDSIFWNYVQLPPLQVKKYLVKFLLATPPVITFGDRVKSHVSIYSANGDENPFNNFVDAIDTIWGSFDPNDMWVDKEKLLVSELRDSTYLQYRIRFQNTGNDTAFNVVVYDTLEENFNRGSLQMTDISHTWEMTRWGNDILEWRFSNILLPDSNIDEPGSHGHILFDVLANEHLVPGETVSNAAAIVFDFNVPVLTNTVTTSIVQPVGFEHLEITQMEFDIHPNPASDVLQIAVDENLSSLPLQLLLLGIDGQVMKSIPVNSCNISFELDQLADGVYLAELKDEAGNPVSRVKKIVVKK